MFHRQKLDLLLGPHIATRNGVGLMRERLGQLSSRRENILQARAVINFDTGMEANCAGVGEGVQKHSTNDRVTRRILYVR